MLNDDDDDDSKRAGSVEVHQAVRPDGMLLEFHRCPQITYVLERLPHTKAPACAIQVGDVERAPNEQEGDYSFVPRGGIILDPENHILQSVLRAYLLAIRMVCRIDRELEGQPDPVFSLRTMAKGHAMEGEFITYVAIFKQLNAECVKLGGYPIDLPHDTLSLSLGWETRERIRRNALTLKQIEAMEESNARLTFDLRGAHS